LKFWKSNKSTDKSEIPFVSCKMKWKFLIFVEKVDRIKRKSEEKIFYLSVVESIDMSSMNTFGNKSIYNKENLEDY
jgi:hypothetical protein